MRWLLDEEYDRLIENAKLEERARILKIINTLDASDDNFYHKDCSVCDEHKFTALNLARLINAEPQNPLPSSSP